MPPTDQDLQDCENKMNEYKRDAETMFAKALEERQDKEKAERALAAKEKELKQLKKQIQENDNSDKELLRRALRLEGENQALKEDVKNKNTEIKDLERDKSDLQTQAGKKDTKIRDLEKQLQQAQSKGRDIPPEYADVDLKKTFAHYRSLINYSSKVRRLAVRASAQASRMTEIFDTLKSLHDFNPKQANTEPNKTKITELKRYIDKEIQHWNEMRNEKVYKRDQNYFWKHVLGKDSKIDTQWAEMRPFFVSKSSGAAVTSLEPHVPRIAADEDHTDFPKNPVWPWPDDASE